jgi:carboxyl-terminal processing protease
MRKRAYIILLLSVAVTTVALKAPDSKYFEIARNLDIFATLFKEVNAFYVDEIDPEELVSTGIYAMLGSLDPYTTYIPEEQLEEYRTMTTGLYGGIGAVVGTINDKTLITMLYEGYGANKAGMKIGDEIIEIDGTKLSDRGRTDVTKLLKGQAGTPVTIKVIRNNKESKQFTFDRETIRIENVPYYANITADVGYIRLSDFTMGASREVEQALKALKNNGANKIIIDLRSNPGGLLNEAINISNLFIPRGEEVVSTKGKVDEWNKTYKALNQPIDKNIPLVVLTNNMSASASEIVAGVIQDYDRGVLIGRRTFGKGLVQATRPLTYNTQLKVTTAKYYIPSGRCIQAIDYAERNEDGGVSNIPDSLKVAFKTKNNRVVYDGGGLEPDISVAGNDWSAVAISLLTSGHIFDYATQYYYTHDQIEAPDVFEFTEAEYGEFATWLADKGYTYESSLESSVDRLLATAAEKESSEELIEKMNDLKAKIVQDKKNDLLKYKDEIKRLLRQEIVSRYYLHKGDMQAALKGDPDLKTAIEVLSNEDQYQDILSQ